MLKIMRSHKFFTVFILGAITVMIIIVFIFWGIGPQMDKTQSIVAQVDSETITPAEYERAYAAAYRSAWEMYQNEEEIKKMNLRIKVLDELIDNLVLMSAAKRAGLTVTEKELQEAIMNEPAFQTDGVFNKEIYARRLKLNRMNPAMYENAIKNELLLNKMRLRIAETSDLTADELNILNSIKGDKGQLSGFLLYAKRELAIKAYVEGLKRQMKITINKEFIS